MLSAKPFPFINQPDSHPAMSQAPVSPSIPRKKSRAKLYVITGLVLAVVALVVVAAIKRNQTPAIAVTFDAAAIRDVTQLVTATGKVQSETEVKISPEVAGEIIAMPVVEGQRVKKGELLFRIKPDSYQSQVQQYEAALASSRANSLLTEAQLGKAQADFRQSDDLYKQNLISEADYTTAKTNLAVARANYAVSLAQISQAQGSLNQASDLLSKTTIYSPMDGTISAKECEIGDRVVGTAQFAGTEVMRVADFSHMELQVDVNENDVVNVKVGDTARLSIDAYPNRVFLGTVKEIASTATTTNANTQQEVTTFQVKIRIPDPGVALRPGMSGTADIETQTARDAITVPIQSVTVRSIKGGLTSEQLADQRQKAAQKNKGENQADVTDTRSAAQRQREENAELQRVVFIKNGDVVRLQPVTTGIQDNTYIVITSGVKAGDQVVSGSYAALSRTLKNGSRVEREKPQPVPAQN